MARKYDPKKMSLHVNDVIIGKEALIVRWSSEIGFGEYTLYIEDGKWKGDSECTDRGEDKAFLEEVLKKASEYILKETEIVG